MIVEEETGALVGTAEQERVYSTVHAGAVDLHLGRPVAVTELHLETRPALARPVTVDWYTEARKETATEIAESIPARVMSRASSSTTGGSSSPSKSSGSSGRRSPTEA